MSERLHPETPHHPTARHPRTAHHIKWSLPSAAVIIGLVVGFGIVMLSRSSSMTFTPHLLHTHSVTVGETARSDIYEMTVSRLVRVESDVAFPPAAGDDILVVTLKLQNTSHQSLGFFPSIQTYIRDDQGNTYVMHPTLAMADPLPAGDIAAGQTVTGQLSYEIPKKLTTFRLYVDPAWLQMVPVVFELKP